MTAPFPTLTTDRLILRTPQASDVAPWTAFFLSDRSSFVRGGDQSEELAWRALGHAAGMWMLRGYGSFVFALKDAPDQGLGLTGPWYPAGWPEPELGWTVWDAKVEGTGLAFEAATAARHYAYDVLGWARPVSYIAPDNVRSIKLAERLGAVLDPSAQPPAVSKDCVVYRHPGVL